MVLTNNGRKRRLIGIAGRAGSGKGTLAEHFYTYYYFVQTSFAAPLKRGCAVMFGYPLAWNNTHEGKLRQVPGQNFTVRQALQIIGTEGARTLDPDVWINYANQRWKESSEDFVYEDVRFENEGKWIKSQGGIIVKCVNHDHIEDPTHVSEDLSWLTNPDEIVTCCIVNETGEGYGNYREKVPYYAEQILRRFEEKF